MDTYPVAGKALSVELAGGVTFREAAKLFVPPLLIIGIGNGFEFIPWELYGALAGILIAFGVFTVLITPGSQSPYKYAKASVEYYLGETTFYNRHARPEFADGKIKDESLVWEEYGSRENIIAAARQGKLLDDD